MAHKYGRPYADAAKINASNNVNTKVLKRLGIEAPPKILVENYLIEIAKNFNVPYEPDQSVMLVSTDLNYFFYLKKEVKHANFLRAPARRVKSSSIWENNWTVLSSTMRTTTAIIIIPVVVVAVLQWTLPTSWLIRPDRPTLDSIIWPNL